MNDTYKRIRAGGRVRRWHTIPVINEETVAHHSWGVATVLLALWPDCSRELLVAALYHDVHESVTGDIPKPAFWRNPNLADVVDDIEEDVQRELGITPALTDKEKEQLAIADMFDLCFRCEEEILLGNKSFEDILRAASAWLWGVKLEGAAEKMRSSFRNWMKERGIL